MRRDGLTAGASGLCDLYVGIDGHAQGRHGRAWNVARLFNGHVMDAWTFSEESMLWTLFSTPMRFDFSVWEIFVAAVLRRALDVVPRTWRVLRKILRLVWQEG